MTLEILDNIGLMTIKIMRAINKQVYEEEVLNKKLEKLAYKIRDFLYNKFLTSETYASLAGGILRAEFGLDDTEVANLPYIISEMISVDIGYQKSGSKVNITINMCKVLTGEDLSTLGVYMSESKNGSFMIHWLFWLLTEGEKDVVPEYSIWLKPGAGRSEMAFMFHPKEGGSYSVDGQFSGTVNDNWITRTLRDNKEELTSLIIKTMNNPIKKK